MSKPLAGKVAVVAGACPRNGRRAPGQREGSAVRRECERRRIIHDRIERRDDDRVEVEIEHPCTRNAEGPRAVEEDHLRPPARQAARRSGSFSVS